VDSEDILDIALPYIQTRPRVATNFNQLVKRSSIYTPLQTFNNLSSITTLPIDRVFHYLLIYLDV
jgi:hypothetical protein